MRAVAALLLATLAAGCGGGDTFEARLRVVVPDNNIREEGVECAGARPFRAIHRGTDFEIRAGGERVADGELPTGRSVNAEPEIDWGVDRIPTHCVFDLDVDLPERERYELVLPDVLPIAFERRLLGDEPVRLVLSG